MLSKNKIKYISALQKKKFRSEFQSFLAEGDKIVRELVAFPQWEVECVLAVPEWLERHQGLFQGSKTELITITPDDLHKISTLQTPNQVLAIVKMRLEFDWRNDFSGHLALYLDGIQDPGNLGTILRIADWFGIGVVFLSPDCVELYNPKVIQASMGSFLRVQTATLELPVLKRGIPTLRIYGTLLEGKNVFDLHLDAPALLLIGNEGKGIREAYLPLIDQAISIPRHAEGGAESLNAAVATGIICAALRLH
jgi:TrmH family RNA methyltransferase